MIPESTIGRKRHQVICLLAAVIFIPFFSCSNKINGQDAVTDYGYGSYTVYVIQEFWHTGIVFKIEDVDTGIWPEIEMYQDRNHIDVGWGDEKFYQASGIPVFLAARAMLWPTQSVMQIYAFNLPVESAYGGDSRILRVPMTEEQFERLTGYIAESYKHDDEGNPVTSTAYGETNHYFMATRKYHLFRTCNTWVARAFRESGFDVRSFMILNANQLYRQLSGIPGAEFVE